MKHLEDLALLMCQPERPAHAAVRREQGKRARSRRSWLVTALQYVSYCLVHAMAGKRFGAPLMWLLHNNRLLLFAQWLKSLFLPNGTVQLLAGRWTPGVVTDREQTYTSACIHETLPAAHPSFCRSLLIQARRPGFLPNDNRPTKLAGCARNAVFQRASLEPSKQSGALLHSTRS
jgi:hypothetical protein